MSGHSSWVAPGPRTLGMKRRMKSTASSATAARRSPKSRRSGQRETARRPRPSAKGRSSRPRQSGDSQWSAPARCGPRQTGRLGWKEARGVKKTRRMTSGPAATRARLGICSRYPRGEEGSTGSRGAGLGPRAVTDKGTPT
eukprot:1007880-Heterocapsa_arctica.AAC.1